MYLAEVRLVNWRSYQDVTFEFPVPAKGKPLVLVGAMNGHGKTSLLLGLYFGIFGRFGTRHAEGFQLGGDDIAATHYRRALQEFRRRGADPGDPTEVHVTIAPTKHDPPGAVRFHIERRWFFNSASQLRERGEEVGVYIDDVPQRIEHADDASELIENHLFPAHVLPAFFFDGEQAQKRIEDSGDAQMQQAVEVLFGTRLLSDLREQLGRYVGKCREELAGKNVSTAGAQIDALREKRDRIDARLEALTQEVAKLVEERDAEMRKFQDASDQASRLGLSSGKQLERFAERLNETRVAMERRNEELRNLAASIALPLGASRVGRAARKRLTDERVREEWETLKMGTLNRIDRVVDRALPSPDPLLDGLDVNRRTSLRDRFRTAIESIYEPPPEGCAPEFRYAHVRGELRDQVRRQLDDALALGSTRIESAVKAARTARDEHEEARRRHQRFQNLPEEAERLKKQMESAQERLGELNSQIGALQNEETSLREDLKQVKAEIGRIETDLNRLAPAQRRAELANRVRDVINDFADELAPLALQRLAESVTTHFRAMADRRFRAATVKFEGGEPMLVSGAERFPIRGMSGYERRTFGVAFSLALAEVSGFRAPLVIDTPLGNADSEYRQSLLNHIVRANLDQIVILTHDEEVVGRYYDAVKDRVGEHFLVRYEQTGGETGESWVHPGKYFGKR